MEDFGAPKRPLQPAILISTKRKRASQGDNSQTESQDLELTQSWREILGAPPPMGTTQVLHAVSKETHRTAKITPVLPGCTQKSTNYCIFVSCMGNFNTLYLGGKAGVAALP